jgi:ureidoglycolate lyase
MTAADQTLNVEALTREAFAPFGDVIEAGAHRTSFSINAGNAVRFHDLADIDTLADGGRPCVSIVRAQPYAMPMRIRILERHLRGSQAFVPLGGQRFLIVVAPGADLPDVRAMRCFVASARQGVNYRRGTWHHPLLAIDRPADFLVVDRVAELVDCEERQLDAADVRTIGTLLE